MMHKMAYTTDNWILCNWVYTFIQNRNCGRGLVHNHSCIAYRQADNKGLWQLSLIVLVVNDLKGDTPSAFCSLKRYWKLHDPWCYLNVVLTSYGNGRDLDKVLTKKQSLMMAFGTSNTFLSILQTKIV